MKHIHRILTIVCLSILCISSTIAQSEVTDYLSVGTQIEFNEEDYQLKWSSHPTEVYYKQEYLRADDQLPKYQKMLMVEAVKGDIPAENAANAKINELENWKKRNPIVRYEKTQSGNDIILEFVVSDGNSIYEWNIYRYRNEKNDSGNYLVLYSYSYRNYGSEKEDETTFLKEIKASKKDLVKMVEAIELPEVNTE